MRAEGKALVALPLVIPQGHAGISVRFDPQTLPDWQLCLRERRHGGGVVLVGESGLVTRAGKRLASMERSGELLLTPSGLSLFVDGRPVALGPSAHDASWVLAAGASPPPRAVAFIPRVEVRDDFMRQEIEGHPYSRITAGSVRLAQHGGGMPVSDSEKADPTFQRAVNPFSVCASDGGTLTYVTPGADRWGDVHAEARFYFGVPKTGDVVDRQTLPVDTDMLVVQGADEGAQVAFGWSGAARAFVLQARQARGDWEVIERWQGLRPPLTNWVKIGLAVLGGHRAEAYLDGVRVLDADLGLRIRGPFRLASGRALIEFDDVRAWSLPPEPGRAPALYVSSRQFAGKYRNRTADPEQFDEWASSAGVFARSKWQDPSSGERRAGIVTRMPLMGNVWCDATEDSSADGPLPEGLYDIGLYAPREEEAVDIALDTPLCTLRVERRDGLWQVPWGDRKPAGGQTPPEAGLSELHIGRLGDHGSRLCVLDEGRWVPVSLPAAGPVHVAVVRVLPASSGRRVVFSPSPKHFVVRCGNLVNEFFEEAPADWSWVDGTFRMDCRWACQDQWNFMACGSTGLPYMTSKRTFQGDQVHEFFVSLRAVVPWDAGDESFSYDPDADEAGGHRVIRAHNGWYNRRDLNFSLCADGRDPLSGYSVVFGGDDNTETRLMRGGQVIATSRLPESLFPAEPSFMSVHYNWWKFTITRLGARIRVALDDQLLFDYADPDPLPGGHIGFWSIRNGFAISRLTSVAQSMEWRPQVLYVATSADSAWHPLVRDAVALALEPDSRWTRVTNAVGGGFFAVRCTPASPVDLNATPILQMPLALGPDALVNVHLEIGGEPFLIRLGGAPLAGMKAFLTPCSERGECFQLQTIPEGVVKRQRCLAEVQPGDGGIRIDLVACLERLQRPAWSGRLALNLTSLTVGNSSNEGYLLAGAGGNKAGRFYLVGTPVFAPRHGD
ncbi:MAG: hypothetical protein JXR77_13885 [Lentisphaeria bacterium]|nr:hypothetical protein [Lentisphaeria bacterium]